MIIENNLLKVNYSPSSDEILISKLTNLIAFFSYLSEKFCMLEFFEISTNTIKDVRITAAKLNTEYKLHFHNQTTILVKSNSNHETSLVSIRSVLACFMPNISNVFSTDNNQFLDHRENNTTLDFLANNEHQSVLYVIAILSLFTVIFALILLYTYHFNQQDAELYESRRYLEKFKLSYDYRKQSLVQDSLKKKHPIKKMKKPIIKIETT